MMKKTTGGGEMVFFSFYFLKKCGEREKTFNIIIVLSVNKEEDSFFKGKNNIFKFYTHSKEVHYTFLVKSAFVLKRYTF